jgi:hypothetical protein
MTELRPRSRRAEAAAIGDGAAVPLEPATWKLGRALVPYGLRIAQVYGNAFEITDPRGSSMLVRRKITEHEVELTDTVAMVAAQLGVRGSRMRRAPSFLRALFES